MILRRVPAVLLLVLAAVAFWPASPAVAQQAVLDKALFDASWQGNAEEVARLLKAGAKPNVITNGSMPLHKAAMLGHVEVMKLLIDGGAVVNAKGLDGRTPLVDAAGRPKLEATKLLLDAGAKPDGLAM